MKNPRPRLPEPTLLDKVIRYVDPKRAQQRMVARYAMALAGGGGGYKGARRDRAALASMSTFAGSPDSDVIADLPALRARSRELERNAPVAAGAINTTATHVVGTGLSCNPKLGRAFLGLSEEQATEWERGTRERFRAWCKSTDVDLARTINFYQLQDVAIRAALASGDCFVVTPRVARTGKPKRLALQLVEADRVCNPSGKQDSATLTDGIEHDAATGEPLKVHVCNVHPSDFNRGKREWQAIEVRGGKTGRRNVLHLFKVLRPGLRRGVPLLAPVLEPLRQLEVYTDAELQAAVTSALFAVFVKMEPGAFDDLFEDDAKEKIVERGTAWSGEMESAKAINLLPGESIETASPGRPNAQFDPFVAACMRQIGMAIGLPYEVLVMHYDSSYSAARAALLHAWRFFQGWRDWLATTLCQPVYELWLADEVAEGRIAAPGFFADDVVRAAWCNAQWVGDGAGSIDPQKEVGAARERVALGISTLQAESQLHDGVDWEEKHEQSVREAAARREAGLSVPGAAAPAPGGTAPPGDDGDQAPHRNDGA